MAKFKQGDRVRRTGKDYAGVVSGGEYFVRGHDGRTSLLLSDLTGVHLCGSYISGQFELVANELDIPEEPDPYLSQEAVFRNLLGGVSVQYFHCGEWLDINNTEEVTVHFIRSVKCRLKPSTVLVNDKEVVRPISKNLVGTRGKYFSFRLDINRVVSTDVHAGGLMWATHEDAYAALQAVRCALEVKSS